jgi:serine/threonine protein kinase
VSAGLTAGSIVAERYRVIDRLGEGTFGDVFRVERIADGTALAMKVLKESDPMSRARLRREASALARLAHPNVVSVVELGEDTGHMFLVSELLVGTSLDARLEAGLMDASEGLRLFDLVLGGLAFAHAMGVAHRDLKPGNIFLVRGSGAISVKLLDFGLAKFHEPAAFGHHTVLTANGAILGTPDYMAPEQIFGPSVDARADVYAAGVVLFEVLTGRVPFTGEDLPDLFRAHAMEKPPTLSAACPARRFAPELEAVVARALEKRPENRYAEARAMRTAMARLPKGRALVDPSP